MTVFETALEQAKNGQLKTPSVSSGAKQIDYFGYQLSVHKMNLSLMAKGFSCRGIKFTDIKKYYGLTGRSAKDCLPQFIAIFEKYKEDLKK
jgi:hypothetical protein